MMRSHHSYISQATDCVHVDIISVNRACPRVCPIIDNFREINFTKFFVNFDVDELLLHEEAIHTILL